MLLTLTLQVFVVVFIISLLWHIFKKAGQPGWASLVPGYNVYILLKIAGIFKIASFSLSPSFNVWVDFLIGVLPKRTPGSPVKNCLAKLRSH